MPLTLYCNVKSSDQATIRKAYCFQNSYILFESVTQVLIKMGLYLTHIMVAKVRIFVLR